MELFNITYISIDIQKRFQSYIPLYFNTSIYYFDNKFFSNTILSAYNVYIKNNGIYIKFAKPNELYIYDNHEYHIININDLLDNINKLLQALIQWITENQMLKIDKFGQILKIPNCIEYFKMLVPCCMKCNRRVICPHSCDTHIFTHSEILEIMKLNNCFNFIQVLNKSDQTLFIDEYLKVLNSDIIHLKYYQQGYIKISTWIQIMNIIDGELNYHYCIYRDSYYGENTGITEINQNKSDSYKSMLIEYGEKRLNTIDLYISNKTISVIYFFRKSNYTNPKKWFWDNIIK